MLVLSRFAGETINIYIGDVKVTVEVVSVFRGKVKVGLTAPENVEIVRKEIDKHCLKAQKEAS